MQCDEFSNILKRDFTDILTGQSRIAVAVSGGPDSAALCLLLDQWAAGRDVAIHALHVDHGLRDESADEANHVDDLLAGLGSIQYYPLKWEGEKPDSGVQETARKARYALMVAHCRAHDIAALFLAHHRDDQAETLLFRLAKGSGLDGLSGMRARQVYDTDLTLCRPLLGVEKQDLVALCANADLSYLDDPSNQSDDFARVRLRQSRAVLEEEGLSNKRLAITAMRLSRAREALEHVASFAYDEALKELNTDRIVFNIEPLQKQPEDIMLRVIMVAITTLIPNKDYAPRMEKLEALLHDLRSPNPFRKRTLGGVVFVRDDKIGHLTLERE